MLAKLQEHVPGLTEETYKKLREALIATGIGSPVSVITKWLDEPEDLRDRITDAFAAAEAKAEPPDPWHVQPEYQPGSWNGRGLPEETDPEAWER